MTHSMLQTFDVPIRRSTAQAVSVYVYAYSNDIHNVSTNVFLTQQLFTVLFFLIKFKTLGLAVEPGLATKLCAKALSSK